MDLSKIASVFILFALLTGCVACTAGAGQTIDTAVTAAAGTELEDTAVPDDLPAADYN
jgi:uncharacterized membrane protein YkvI